MKDFETVRTGVFRNRWVYCVFGFIFTKAGVYWGGKLFDLVLVQEEKVKWRYSCLDEMYYTIYWSEWIEKWDVIKIL